ncbi:LOB domain-containing protein 38 [Senna tora]|uniref:LOB domain-containing protein 38 n=1 Tax=Senna tora TaxID=362788 RepID=A0A835CLS0_9FABA|nr:LOB domain-containing protein 38 [Senna tora]
MAFYIARTLRATPSPHAIAHNLCFRCLVGGHRSRSVQAAEKLRHRPQRVAVQHRMHDSLTDMPVSCLQNPDGAVHRIHRLSTHASNSND